MFTVHDNDVLELMDYQKTLRALTDFGIEPEREVWTLSKKIREMTAAASNAHCNVSVVPRCRRG